MTITIVTKVKSLSVVNPWILSYQYVSNKMQSSWALPKANTGINTCKMEKTQNEIIQNSKI